MILKINKKVRNGLAITTVLLLSGIIYLLYNAIVNPGFRRKRFLYIHMTIQAA